MHEQNMTINVNDLVGGNVTCQQLRVLPHINTDSVCAKENYPVTVLLSLAEQAAAAKFVDDGLHVRASVRVQAFRTDLEQDELLMDFIAGNATFVANVTMDWRMALQANLNIEFTWGKVVTPGRLLRLDRDIFFLTWYINDPTNDMAAALTGMRFKNLAGMVFRESAFKLDGATDSIYFVLNTDPVYIGHSQG